MRKNPLGALWLDYFVMQKGEKSVSNYGNIFCQPALMECCQGKSLIIKKHVSVNVIFCRSPKGIAYVLPGERHCWINHQAFLTNGTLLSILYKGRLFSWKERCFSFEQHTRHAGSSCSEACEQLRFFSGKAAHIALQASTVADGLTETLCKQVAVPFGGIMKPSGRHFWKLSCSVLGCSPCIPASGYWAFCFLCPCHLSSCRLSSFLALLQSSIQTNCRSTS